MFSRSLKRPDKSFILFGPRGTGKSTWLKKELADAHYIDLLKSSAFLELSRDPSRLRGLVGHLKAGSWVVIDEIQRIPDLLNEVHAIYEERRLNFALSGSSARKLKRGGANLLAGRAIQMSLFPLVFSEYGSHLSLKDAIEWGTLPVAVSEHRYRNETLATYVETYLRQELIEEGLIRNLDPFVRFLEIAGLLNGQILNLDNVARESRVGRTTVQKYFEVLEDTLIGYRLPAYRAGLKVKEVGHPKFYFFDSGVARACAGLLDEPADSVYLGFLMETFLLNEIRAYNHYSKRNRSLGYYKTSGGYEIDLVIETRKKTLTAGAEVICIELKNSRKWDARWRKPIDDFASGSKVSVKKKLGVYRGESILTNGDFTVYPLQKFLEHLHAGKIF